MNTDLIREVRTCNKKELSKLIRYFCEEAREKELENLAFHGRNLRDKYYGPKVFFRGLIEISSYCRKDCYYCGIRCSNNKAIRYRMTKKEILQSCKLGYDIGLRTFVLQGGEDEYYTSEILPSIIEEIRSTFPDCAITLSLGESSYDTYKKLYQAGARRYLLRHETADKKHYKMLHPGQSSFEDRKSCLYNLKEIGFQVGAGFMVDSPYQTYDTLAENLIFLKELNPHMIGIGPFIPHKDTKFSDYLKPTIHNTLVLISLVRIILPKAMLPSTTALSSIQGGARNKGLMAGANVVMPNLTPKKYSDNYNLYDNKLNTGKEAAENLANLMESIKTISMVPDLSRGDHIDLSREICK